MKARKIRQRTAVATNDEEDDDAAAEALRKSVAARKQQKDKKPSKKPLLSFDDDEEGPASVAKKPPAKLKPEFKGLRVVSDAAKASTQRSAPGDYSAERLAELQRNTIRLPPNRPASEAAAPAAAPEPAFKLSGSFKQANAPKQPGQALVSPKAPEADDDMPLPPPARPASRDATAAATHAATTDNHDQDDDGPTFQAPDEDTIRKIKERRARMQHAHMAPDYIPVGGGGADTLQDSIRSAAAKEGSGSDSEPEAGDDLRMSFLGDTKKRGKAAPGVFAHVAEEAQERDDSDDEDRWAKEQIKKGTAGSADPTAVAAARTAVAASVPQGGYGRGSMGAMGVTPAAAAGAVWLAQPDQLTLAGQDVVKTLQQGVAQLQASHKNAEKQLQRTSQNLADSIAAVDTLAEQLQAAGERYAFLQQTKAYISDLCDMLQSKSPIVEELEEHMLGLQSHRATVAADSSSRNDLEEWPIAQKAVEAANGVLSRGGAEAAAAAAAQRAAGDAQQHMMQNLPEKLDEFGRDENMELREEIEQRANKRAARYAQVPAQQSQDAAEPQWGDATSDESDSELSHYRSRRGEALEAAQSVFADAAEEYGSLPAVKRRLEDWKREQPSAYMDAYMSMNVAAVLAPFVRLELLQWDPIYGSNTGFDSQGWYQQLFEYGLNANSAQAQSGSDPDEELIPCLVTQLVLPLASHSFKHAWKPHSRRSTAAAKAVLEDLLVYVPPEEPKLQDVLASIRQRLEQAVAAMHIPQWPQSATAVSPQAINFQARLFGRALRLLHNCTLFDGILPRSVLQDLALVQLLQKQLLPYLRTSSGNLAVAIERSSRVLSKLTPATAIMQGSSKFLAPFADFLAAMARSLEAQQNRATSQHKRWAKQLAALLNSVGSSQKAQDLLAAFPT